MADQNDITILEQINALQKESIELQEKLIKADKEQIVVMEKLQELEDSALRLEKEKLSTSEKAVQEHIALSELYTTELNAINNQLQAAENLFDMAVQKRDEIQKQIDEKKSADLEVTEEEQKQLDVLNDQLENLFLQKEELKDSAKETKALQIAAAGTANAYDRINGVVGGIGTFLIGAPKFQASWLGRMQETVRAAGGISSALSQAGRAAADALAPANVFAGLLSKIAQSTLVMVKQTDSALASFNQATGAGGRFNEQIVAIGDSNLEFGVGIQESAQAFQALHSNLSQFTTLSAAAQNRAANLATQLQGVGISADLTATNLDLATGALGMTIDEAIASQRRLADLSEQLGVAPQQMAADFAAAVPALAAHGPAMETVFVDLAKQAKATGIEVQSLISIAKQFDTFEGAATAAGKLNAILGGGLLNSVELLTASEAERIAMLRESIEMSGRNFDSMNKFERMAIASAAGITDMAEASRLFGSTSIEFTKMQKEQKTLQERAAASADIQKKLNNMMQMFAVAVLPVVNVLHGMFDILFKVNNFFGGAFIPILTGAIGVLALVVKGYQAWNAVTTVATALTGTHTAAVAASTTAQQAATTASGGFTKALSANAANLVKLGVALLLAGTGIGLAAAGIALLASQMKGMGSEAWALVAVVTVLGATMVGLVATMLVLGPEAAAAGVAFAPLALALLGIGAAIGIAAAGIALIVFGVAALVDSFGSLFKILIDGAPALPQTAAGMYMIAGALLALSFAGLGIVAVGAAFGVLTAGVVSLAAALALISTDELLAVADIAKGISGITIEKSVAFSGAMESLEGSVTALATVPPATMANVTEFVRRISEVTAVAGGGGAGIAGPAGAPGAPGAAGPAPRTAPAAGEREIVLKIGEREFARAVINIFDKEMKLNMVGN